MLFRSAEYIVCANLLRGSGIACDVFPENRKIAQQFTYAEKKGLRFAVMRGQSEKERGVWVLRDLASRESKEYETPEAVAEALKELLLADR